MTAEPRLGGTSNPSVSKRDELDERLRALAAEPAPEGESRAAQTPPPPRAALQQRIIMLAGKAAAGTNEAAGQARIVTSRAINEAARLGREAQKRAGPALQTTQEFARRAMAQTKQATATAMEVGRTKVLPTLADLLARLGERLKPERLNSDYRHFLLRLHEMVLDRPVERLFFAPTKGVIRLEKLTIRSENRALGHGYCPTPRLVFDWAMTAIGEDLRNFTFVDYGAGKGRALLLAAHYPFAAVRGIEFAEELHNDALMNIAQFPRSLMKCRDVECTLADVVDVPPPEGEAVLYFFNPFEAPVFSLVLSRVAVSYRLEPRRIYVVLVNCRDFAPIEQTGIFKPVRLSLESSLRATLLSPYPIAVYRSLA